MILLVVIYLITLYRNIIDSIYSDHVQIKTVIELEIVIRLFSGNVSDSGIHDPYVVWHRAENQHINAYKELRHHQLSELAMSTQMFRSCQRDYSVIKVMKK